MLSSIYIHIPFCIRKCLYCDFASFPGKESIFDQYLDALKTEINRDASGFPDANISTIYFGGGTPNVLSSNQLGGILDKIKQDFAVDADAEITIEANPGIETDMRYFTDLRDSGFNRISMGIQSVHEEELQLLGRIHSASDSIRSFQAARQAGFRNISVDAMYGIPGQTRESWRETLKKLLLLEPDHISLYALTIEEETPFLAMRNSGKLDLPGEDIEADMHEEAISILSVAGFEHYEISNFAKPGFTCRHNLTYWRNEPYFGFGAGAASYLRGVRSANVSEPEEYIRRMESGESAVAASESLIGKAAMGETVFLGLRMLSGLNIESFKQRYGLAPMEVFGPQIKNLTERGLLEQTEADIRLTHSGLLFANDVFAEFVS